MQSGGFSLFLILLLLVHSDLVAISGTAPGVAVCLDCVLSCRPYNQSLQSLGSRDRAGDDIYFLWKILK